MSFLTKTTKSTEDYSDNLKKLKDKIDNNDAIIIGAGAGLSTAAGYTYSGKRFLDNFATYNAKYGFTDMYSGGFYPYKTQEEFWAFWSKYIYLNRYTDTPSDLYENLLKLVENKDYFVLTTNVDHCFQKAGFDKKRLFYTQGDYGLFQCSEPCCQETFDNEKMVLDMLNATKNMKIPTELIPLCPHCKRPLTTNLRADDKFVEDEGWHKASERYSNFLTTRNGQKILFFELGVGYNTPGIIKYPFWQYTFQNKNSTYACLNKGEVYIPDEIKSQSIGIDCDIKNAIEDLLNL